MSKKKIRLKKIRRERLFSPRTNRPTRVRNLTNHHYPNLFYNGLLSRVQNFFFNFLGLIGLHPSRPSIDLRSFGRRRQQMYHNRTNASNRLLNLYTHHIRPGFYVFNELLRSPINNIIQGLGGTWFTQLINWFISYIYQMSDYWSLFGVNQRGFTFLQGMGRLSAGAINNISNILAIFIFVQATSTRASRRLRYFLNGFFLYLRSEFGIRTLDTDIQVRALFSLVTITHYPFNYCSKELSTDDLAYKKNLPNVYKQTTKIPPFKKYWKQLEFVVSNCNSTLLRAIRGVMLVSSKVCNRALSLIINLWPSTLFILFLIISVCLSRYSVYVNINNFLHLFGWEHYNIYYCMDIHSGGVWEIYKSKSKPYFISKELLDCYLHKYNFIHNTGSNISSDPLPQINSCAPTDIYSDADNSTDCSDDESEND